MTKWRIKEWLKLGGALLLLVGCGDDLEDDGLVLAKVGEHEITLADYRTHLERMPDALRSEFDVPRYLQAIIDEELLQQEAKQRGLDRSPELKRKLQQEEQVLIMRELYQREGIERSAPSEEELRAYFARSPYNRHVRFSLLMVRTREQLPPLLEELKRGADFEELSMKHSQDSRILERNADMGYHRWGETMLSHKALTEKAFTMKPGEIAGPLQVAGGYFLIKLTDIHPISFEQERETIEQLLFQERLGQQLSEYYGRLQERYKLSYDSSGLQFLSETVAEGMHAAHQDSDKHGSGVTVLTYEGGTVTLDQCLDLLRESRRSIPRDGDALRQLLESQVSRQLFVPLEVERLDLTNTEKVRQALERTRRKFIVRKLLTQIASQTAPANINSLRLFFEENRERYLQPLRIEVRRMLVEDREKGLEIVERLRSGQDSLGIVDRFVSLTYGSEALQEENPFSRALRAEEGSVHGPLATENGYVVLQILRRHDTRLPPFEEVKKQVAVDVARASESSLFQSFLKELRKRRSEQIMIHQERVQKLALLSSNPALVP